LSLGRIARAGFVELASARGDLESLAERTGISSEAWLDALTLAADPDGALGQLSRAVQDPEGSAELGRLAADPDGALLLGRLCRLLGASPGLGEFFLRHRTLLPPVIRRGPRPPRPLDELRERLLAAVRVDAEGVARLAGEDGWNAIRIGYRELLAEITLYDLEGPRAQDRFDLVALALSDLAEAAIDASLAVARGTVIEGHGIGRSFPRAGVLGTRFAVIAMGKCGAEELNVVSDVDVIFVGESGDPELSDAQAIEIATRLGTEVMRGLHEYALEPPLWQVDPNLRPEGKNGPLVRSLDSHLAYYERWAQTWEFQALLKARFIAGDRELGEAYVARTRPLVWASSDRPDFVGSVQRMRERVTEQLPDDAAEVQLKLGPGGLRDVEFAVQLLQLVHGQGDDSLRVRGTIAGIDALVLGGYIARTDAEELASAYREIRVLEHRLQLRHLRRTAVLPRDEAGLRWLARASGFASTADGLMKRFEANRRVVRELHLKIFYAPLL
ncbi:bifunctional glutamine-synthetase adenylyltransferase/deadenyltransferase, partial [Leucobacter sp. M11]|nr:bifunctional glutamine-synthetase adenylyltransferase/deadenyltransferase [Leucobacter sp. M11]